MLMLVIEAKGHQSSLRAPADATVNGGKWTESNLLPKKDCVYSAATAPAYPYLHFPNWRKHEVLIPNGARPSISLRTNAGLLSGYVSVFGGRLSARCSYARGVPFALQAMPTP